MSEVANTSDAKGTQAGTDGAQGGPTTNRRGNRLPRDERRGQLLIAASDVFVDRGYHAAGEHADDEHQKLAADNIRELNGYVSAEICADAHKACVTERQLAEETDGDLLEVVDALVSELVL